MNNSLAPVTVTSFGYGHQDENGHPVPPPSAHITIDVRTHFRDPHVSPELRHLTGADVAVVDAVMTTPGVFELIAATVDQVAAFRAAPVSGPIAIAVGCVGGRHRSVVIASFIAAMLPGKVGIVHRDIGRPVIARPLAERSGGQMTDLEVTTVLGALWAASGWHRLEISLADGRYGGYCVPNMRGAAVETADALRAPDCPKVIAGLAALIGTSGWRRLEILGWPGTDEAGGWCERADGSGVHLQVDHVGRPAAGAERER